MGKYKNSYIKVYQNLKVAEISNEKQEAEYLVKFEVLLEDKPGSLADFSFLIAQTGVNIGFFHYDRSIDCNRVVAEVQFKERNSLYRFLQLLRENYSSLKNKILGDDIQIITPESILEIKVRLINKPGSLATFARLLKKHRANVIYMLYNEDIDPESADIALATENPEEVNNLLGVINSKAYNYKVVYRGSDTEEVERIIGLKLVEKFFLRLQKLVNNRDVQQLMAIVDSSKKLYAELVSFYSEVGNHLEKGDIFSSVLTFASTSIAKVGKNFSVRELLPLQFGDNIQLFTFRLPTGGNIFVFHHHDKITMFDAGYGLYYQDIKVLFTSMGIEPCNVRRIFISHADADHIGSAGYFAKEFGTEVFMHPNCKGIIDNENRAYSVNTKPSKLNKHFTVLVNRFTKCRYPEKVSFFATSAFDKVGAFNVIDTFPVGNSEFQVLESHGGHIPGQVFFLNREHGLFFTCDYLINVDSLSDEEKDYMRLPKYLMTSTNTNSQVFKDETGYLMDVVFLLDKELKRQGKFVLIFPGHGDYYRYQGQFPFFSC